MLLINGKIQTIDCWISVSCILMLSIYKVSISNQLGLGLEKDIVISGIRCVVQLTLLGYVLKPVFENDKPIFVFGLGFLQAIIATLEVTWNRANYRHPNMYFSVFGSIMFCTFATASIGNAFAIRAEPWFSSREFIPTLGMVMGMSMSNAAVGLNNLMSQIIDRKEKIEMYLAFGASRWEASKSVAVEAIKMALLPPLSRMSIIGLISIPGMMTGQILGGSNVEQAAHYQQVITFITNASACLTTTSCVMFAVMSVFDGRARLRTDRVVKTIRQKKAPINVSTSIMDCFRWLGNILTIQSCRKLSSSNDDADEQEALLA